MPVNKKQLIRLIKFVSELKQNRYPNCKTFAKMLYNIDIDDNINISCSPRTVLRDIKVLIKDFEAPIRFDAEKNGYYLTNHYWEFHCPLLCDNMIITSMLAVRLAEDIVPQPLKNMMKSSIDSQLTTNNAEFLDNTFIDSLIIASGAKVTIKPEIFRVIFDGWRQRRVVELIYQKPDGSQSSRLFEPHIIAFHKGVWYTKGFELPDEKERIFGLHRIISVRLGKGTFEISKKLLEDVYANGLFNYPKLKNVKLLCDSSIAFYLYEHQQAKHLQIESLENGDLLVTMPPSVEHDLIRWILGEGGNIRVLEPENLRRKILLAGEKLIENNRD